MTAMSENKMANLPKTFKKLVVHKLTTDFRAAVVIESADLCRPKEGEVCVRNRYVGINAADVGTTKGRYVVDAKVPLDCGFEGAGEVVQVGKGVTHLKVGDAVVYITTDHNAFAEYSCISVKGILPVPEIKPEYLVLMVSGLTAAIGLDKNARIINGETVLITAAAGGTGHIAVQWAKAADCHVIATCSTEEKEKVLKELDCDRIINYNKDSLGDVLVREYPNGIDVIWETIGGKVFETCLRNIAIKGRLLVVGGTSSYKDENKEFLSEIDLASMPQLLLQRSAAVQGFFFTQYEECFATYFKYLLENVDAGKIRAIYDLGKDDELVGLEGIIKGVEYLHSGKSIGKVIVKIA